ncbi:hypothetical protein ABMB67_001944 [Halalkalibacter oceani]
MTRAKMKLDEENETTTPLNRMTKERRMGKEGYGWDLI